MAEYTLNVQHLDKILNKWNERRSLVLWNRLPGKAQTENIKDDNNKMETRSTKRMHKIFMDEPIGSKPCTDIPGISVALGKRLSDLGFDKAYCVLGQFLLFKKDRELFEIWLHLEISANKRHSELCYECLNEWCNQFL